MSGSVLQCIETHQKQIDSSFSFDQALILFQAGIVPFWPSIRRKSLDACFRGAAWHKIESALCDRIQISDSEPKERLQRAWHALSMATLGVPEHYSGLSPIQYAAISFSSFRSRESPPQPVAEIKLPFLPDVFFLDKVPIYLNHFTYGRESYRRAGKILSLVTGSRKEMAILKSVLLEEVSDIFPQNFRNLLGAVLNLTHPTPNLILAAIELRSYWNSEKIGMLRWHRKASTDKKGNKIRAEFRIDSLALSYQKALSIAQARIDFEPPQMIPDEWRQEWFRLHPEDTFYSDFNQYVVWRCHDNQTIISRTLQSKNELIDRQLDRHDAPVWRATFGLIDPDKLPHPYYDRFSGYWSGQLDS